MREIEEVSLEKNERSCYFRSMARTSDVASFQNTAKAKSKLGSPGAVSRKTRELILDSALRMVAQNGIHGLTIGELAKAVGMSKSGLFAHFGGKDQLQLDVMRLAMDRFVDTVMRPAFKVPRGEPRILGFFSNWLDHLNDDSAQPGGRVLIAASTDLDDRPGPLRDFVQKTQKNLIANIEKAAQMAVDEGHFRRDLDVEQFAWSMYSYILGYHHFKRMLEDPKAELHLKQSFFALVDSARKKTGVRKSFATLAGKKIEEKTRKKKKVRRK